MATRVGGDIAAPVTGKTLWTKLSLLQAKKCSPCALWGGPGAPPGPSSLGVTSERVLRSCQALLQHSKSFPYPRMRF